MKECAISKNDFILEYRLRKLDEIAGQELRTIRKGNTEATNLNKTKLKKWDVTERKVERLILWAEN